MSHPPSFFNPVARDRIGWSEGLFWLLPIVAFFGFPGDLVFATQVLVMMLLAMSLGLVLSFAGIVTLGHAAFFGIGAYATALLSLAGYHEAISATVLGGLAAALLSAVVGPVVLRLSGLSLMIMTLAIAAVLFEAANKADWLTGGENGLGDVQFAPILRFVQMVSLWTNGLSLHPRLAVRAVCAHALRCGLAARSCASGRKGKSDPDATDRRAGRTPAVVDLRAQRLHGGSWPAHFPRRLRGLSGSMCCRPISPSAFW